LDQVSLSECGCVHNQLSYLPIRVSILKDFLDFLSTCLDSGFPNHEKVSEEAAMRYRMQ